MPLESLHFRDNDELQLCLTRDQNHVVPGARGEHVTKIQQALVMLGEAVIAPAEITGTLYGATTSSAVLRFKGPPRNIINKAYQNTPDNIVGKMTIFELDQAMLKIEKVPESKLVSVTRNGAPHDHSKCPPLEAGDHEGTPINPLRFGRMINIFGEHETDYLGFEDFSTDIDHSKRDDGTFRPLTFSSPRLKGLRDNSASDICMRSTVVTDEGFTKITGRPNTIAEIKRIAMPGCRLTYAGTKENIATFGPRILRLGVLMETVLIKTPARIEPEGTIVPASTFTVFVLGIF